MCLASLVPRVSDVQNIVSLTLRIMFYLSPVFYTLEYMRRVPQEVMSLYLYANPMAVFLTLTRSAFTGNIPSMVNVEHILFSTGISIIVFITISSLILSERNEQFGSPTYSWLGDRLWIGDYEKSISSNIDSKSYTPSSYIEEHGVLGFIKNFIVDGTISIFSILSKIMFPYLIFLTPLGIILSFKTINENPKFVKANWIFIIITLAIMTLVISLNPERRFLLYLYPFLIIFATIFIQRFTEYGLSALSFNPKQKNLFLIIFVCSVVIVSGLFTLRYDSPDLILENEKIQFTKYMEENFQGGMLFDSGDTQVYFAHPILWENSELLNQIKIDSEWNDSKHIVFLPDTTRLVKTSVFGNSIEELVENGKSHNLQFIFSTEYGDSFYPFVDELYHDETKYTYLEKIFDSEEFDFKKFKIKAFKINYEKFNEIKN